ncbi:MAG: hypothetical protein WCY09_09325 [Candidatus Omnitrophota bacterium]|jgi:hypothetical protein
MSSMKESMNKWLGNDISHMGSGCMSCDSIMTAEQPISIQPMFTTEPKLTIEPWEYTQDSYVNRKLQETMIPKNQPGYKTMVVNRYIQEHRQSIEDALKHDLEVSDDVLIDYPDLRLVGKKLEKKLVELKTLESGDLFTIEGLLRTHEVLRRQGNHIIARDILNNELDEIPTNTKVVKLGHKSGKPTVCDGMPKDTRDAMQDVSMESWDRFVTIPADPKSGEKDEIKRSPKEMGAVITDDYILGDITTGTKEIVNIKRKGNNIIGTFHTHPGGNPSPGDFDMIDMLNHNDKIQCICATRSSGTKCQCFTPHEPEWSKMRYDLNNLVNDIRTFNKKTHSRYGLKGNSLRKLLRSVGTETYIRGKLPYDVQVVRSIGGAPQPITTRPVVGTKRYTDADKNAANNAWIGAEKYATQLEEELNDEHKKITKVIEELKDAMDSASSVKNAANESGDFVTVYRLDKINDPSGIQALRDEVGKLDKAFIPSSTPYINYSYGSETDYIKATNDLVDINNKISNMRDQIGNLVKQQPVSLFEFSISNPTINWIGNDAQINNLRDEISDLYTTQGELFLQQWISKPFKSTSQVYIQLITVDENRAPLSSISAASNLIQITKEEAISMIDARAEEIKAGESKLIGEIEGLERSIEILTGAERSYPVKVGERTEFRRSFSGGQAQFYRDIIRDKTKSDTERHNAGIKLDQIDYRVKQLRSALISAKSSLKASRYHSIDAKTIMYSPDVNDLISNVNKLTQSVHDMEYALRGKNILAKNARDNANELKVTFDIMAKYSTDDINAAIDTMNDGMSLENRRVEFLDRLHNYERHAGIRPNKETPKNRLFDTCRLIWEEGTLTLPELEENIATVSEAAETRESGE